MALNTYSVLPSSLCALIAIVAWGSPLSCLRADDDGAKLAASSSAATRSLPLNCPAGQPIRVGIDVNPASEVLVHAVDDTAPTGWVISGINEGGVFDESTGKVKWGPFFDNQSRSFSYMGAPPNGWSGVVDFSGTASMDGIGSAIEGDRQCLVAPATPPVIDLQPVSQRVGLGADVTFGVSATGSGALSYQWTRDGLDLPQETGAVLSLSDVAVSCPGAPCRLVRGFGSSRMA